MRRSAHTALTALGALALGTSLHAQHPVRLDTMRVAAGSRLVAGAAATTRSIDVFDRAAIDALPATSITDVIARALGADMLVRSPAQADLSLRGGSFEQVLVLVDGVPMNDRQTGHFHLDVAVPLDAVERIEVVRGPASAIHGTSAVGGVINIVTRKAAAGVGARVQGGTFGTYATSVNAALARDRITAGVSADLGASDGHRDGTDYRNAQARAMLGVPLGPGTIEAAAAFAARDFGASDFYGPYDSYEETRTATASLAWRSAPGTFTIEPLVSVRQHDDDFILLRDDPSFYRNVHTTRDVRAELVTRWSATPRLAMAIGGEAVHSSLASNSLGDRSEHQLATFSEAAFTASSAALLTFGLRADNHAVFGSFLSASVAASYHVSPGVQLRASGATGFRAPSWTDRYYEDPANVGNPELRPEQFRTAEIGARIGAGPLRVDVAAFMRRAQDLIDWGRPAGASDDDPWRTLNVASARFRGLETTARADVAIAALTLRASLLSFDADVSRGFASKYALQPLTRSTSMEVDIPLGATARLGVLGAMYRRADDTQWEVVNARGAIALQGVDIFADVTNLLDAAWLDVSGRPVAGRAFQVGARIRR